MAGLLTDIRNGSYAKKWIAESWFKARRTEERSHPIEQVGERLRALMPFLDPVTVTPEGELRAASAVPVAEAVS